MKKNIYSHVYQSIVNTLRYPIYRYGRSHPQWLANYMYRCSFGRNINWDHPIEFNEKIRWMQFNTDTSIWTLLADKYTVRKYLKEKGYEHILVKLLGKWDNADDIDFGALPNSFVLKTNHGYGEVIVVKDKKNIDEKSIRERMRTYLATPFGYETVEPHYLLIQPCILAEEYLPSDISFSKSILDYKFYCFGGQPVNCGVYYNRNIQTHETQCSFYDMNWHLHNEWKNPRKGAKSIEIPEPENFDEMKNLCYELCKDFPFVRLDLYESNKKIYFGEFTFTPAACTGGSLNPSLFSKYGELIKI